MRKARGTRQRQGERKREGPKLCKGKKKVMPALTGGPQQGPEIRVKADGLEHLRGRRGPQSWVRLCGCRAGRAASTGHAFGQEPQLGPEMWDH